MSPNPPEPLDWLRRKSRQIDQQDGLVVEEQTATSVTVEAWLQRRGVKYAPPSLIPMGLIDEKRSRNNQARRDPLVAESVERFATSFRAGRPFPPIVAYPIGSKLIIIDGNNRHEAAKRVKRESIFGIVIDPTTPSELIQLLTVEANASHGVTPPLDWRVTQAFHLVDIGHDDADAAEAAGITLVQLRNARSAREAEQRARILRIHGFDELTMTAKQYINGIKLEPVFHALADLCARQRFTIDATRDLCRKVKSGRSESEQLAILAEQQDLLVAQNAAQVALKRRVTSPKMALVSGIGLINKIDPAALVSQIRTTHDRDVVLERLGEVVERILEIQVEMEKLKDMEDD